MVTEYVHGATLKVNIIYNILYIDKFWFHEIFVNTAKNDFNQKFHEIADM